MNPTLEILLPDGPFTRTLLVLHGNAGTPEVMRPLYAALTRQGWRVALAGSGQVNEAGGLRWNDLTATDQTVRAWLAELNVEAHPVYFAGFSAGGYVALRGALQGVFSGAGGYWRSRPAFLRIRTGGRRAGRAHPCRFRWLSWWVKRTS